jgi:hypothetical protein
MDRPVTDERNLHYLGLEGAHTLDTQTYLDIERAIKATIEMEGICKVIGDAGVGKSYCTESILLEMGVPYVRVIAASGPTPLRLGRKTVQGIQGVMPRGDRFRMEDICRDLLVNGLALVLDDAHDIPPKTTEFVRQLHDEPKTRFPLLFLGDSGFEDRLINDRQLKSRLTASVDADPVIDSEILGTMRRFHDVFATASEDQLIRVRDDCVGGWMRDWAIFVDHSLREMKKQSVTKLTDEIVSIVIYLMGKRF